MSRRVGELTGAWGRFSEDLLTPSVQAAVEGIGVEIQDVRQRVRSRRAGEVLKETDVVILGILRDGRPVCFVGSVKSSARPEDVDQLVRDVETFHDVYPIYRGALRAGLLAAVGIDANVRTHAARNGIYVVQTGKGVAELVTPPGFVPKIWPAAG